MPERFSADEIRTLSAFFTNSDRDVFGLRLPQEVAGALFSRYSRSAKRLRRVFLDEFHGGEGLAEGLLAGSGETADPAALRKAREFYERVLVGYGDDSVAQLGGAHVALEGISNVAAKAVEDSRVGIAFLEKSTRYVRFDRKDAEGRWLFHPEERLCASPYREAFLTLMDGLFSAYAAQIEPTLAGIRKLLPIEEVEVRHPKSGEPLEWDEVAEDEELLKTARRAYDATVRAHACDVMRGYLPGATRTNVGVFASGQAYEHLINRLLSHPLRELNALGGSLKSELDEMIPAFVKRAQRSDYLEAIRDGTRAMARAVPAVASPEPIPGERVRLLDYDPDAEEKVLAALLYSHTEEPLSHLRSRVAAMPPAERAVRMAELASLRRHRRDKPPRALEAVDYTFDLLGNFGIYRDLHRHRILSQERQLFTTAHGWDVPPEVDEIGGRPLWDACMEEAASLHEKLRGEFPWEAQYVVPFAFRVRWMVRMNLREAIHFCELRSMPQGHPDYRVLVQEIWRQIEAVHPSLAVWGRFVNRDSYRLGRLQSEMRSEYKRGQAAPAGS
jgi:thymidylate synthase ThyX